MKRKRIKYDEGQWFAVPLIIGGFGIGRIVRGNYHTKGGLGYFFGPRYDEIPNETGLHQKNPSDAILIGWFGDLGIVEGEWPLLSSTRDFNRSEWPIPNFRKIDILNPEKGWLLVFDQEATDMLFRIREIPKKVNELADLEDNGLMGSGSVEIELSRRLSR